MTGPVGVRLHRADGTVLNCELADEGVDANGMHQWTIANAIYRPGDRLTVEEIPPHTAVGFHAGPASLIEGAAIDWTDQRGTRRRTTVKVNRKKKRRRR